MFTYMFSQKKSFRMRKGMHCNHPKLLITVEAQVFGTQIPDLHVAQDLIHR